MTTHEKRGDTDALCERVENAARKMDKFGRDYDWGFDLPATLRELVRLVRKGRTECSVCARNLADDFDGSGGGEVERWGNPLSPCPTCEMSATSKHRYDATYRDPDVCGHTFHDPPVRTRCVCYDSPKGECALHPPDPPATRWQARDYADDPVVCNNCGNAIQDHGVSGVCPDPPAETDTDALVDACCETGQIAQNGECPEHHGDACLVVMHRRAADALVAHDEAFQQVMHDRERVERELIRERARAEGLQARLNYYEQQLQFYGPCKPLVIENADEPVLMPEPQTAAAILDALAAKETDG